MKHLHYAGQVLAVADIVAQAIQEGAPSFITAGRGTSWPVACYRDDREEVVQVLVGPGIPILASDPWLPDDRPDPRHSEDSAAYIRAEAESLDGYDDRPVNVVVYGRFDRTRETEGHWSFSGVDGIEGARSVPGAVRRLNDMDYEVVAATESGAPGPKSAWSNVYLIGRRVPH